jgi:hypothetical protein
MDDRLSDPAVKEAERIVRSVRLSLAFVGPLRVALSVVWLVVAPVAVCLAFNDPRARFRLDPEPRPLPSDARVAPAWAHAPFPSAVGVSVLTAVSLFDRPTLVAVRAGILAGLGIAAMISTSRVDPALSIDTRSRVVFRK